MDRFATAAAMAGLLSVFSSRPIDLSHEMTGKVIEHTVERGETLASLGARRGVDPATLAADNGLARNSRLVVGRALRIDTRHIAPTVPGGALVINVPQRMLFLFDNGKAQAAFPVALGRPTWPTPTGAFSVLTKEIDPTWDVPTSIQQEMRRAGRRPLTKVAPGPDNPLGDRWFGLSLPGIGIHGTNAPLSIYHHQTHGCVRLHPEDIHALFDRVPIGTAGEIVYQPVLLAVIDGRVYVESHPDVYRRMSHPLERLREGAEHAHLIDAIDWSRAAVVVREAAGIARDVTAACVTPDAVTGVTRHEEAGALKASRRP
jgi:L,D-transpeptidase ErfK/SrfK